MKPFKNFYLVTVLFIFICGSSCLSASGEGNKNVLPIIDVSNDLVPLGICEQNAVGDGETDQTTAIQASIDYAEEQGGGIVYLPAGQYNLLTVTVPGKVTLTGAGPDKTVVRSLDKEWGLIVLKGGNLMDMTLFGTRPEGSGDNWKVGKGGKGLGGTSLPLACIAVDTSGGATINNVHAFEARYDALYVRDVNGLRVSNCRFDRAGRNVVSLVGNTEDFIFSDCYFGSYWGLYHFDIEHNKGNYIHNGLFLNCIFDGSKAGEMETDTWGSFLCFSGEEKLRNYNVAVVNCEFRDIYIRVQGVFPQVKFINNTFDTGSAAFVRVRTNPVGVFRDVEVRNNRFLSNGLPNEKIVYGVTFTGSSKFAGNSPEAANNITIGKESQNREWHEVHPEYVAGKTGQLKHGQYSVEKKDGIVTVRMLLRGNSIRFEDASIVDYKKSRDIPPHSAEAGDVNLHIDPFIAIGDARIQKVGRGKLADFDTAPKKGYSDKVFGAEAGDIIAIRTQKGKYVIMEIVAMNKKEIEFKYKFVD